MLCLPVLADTARISQLAEITQFIFGRPLRRRSRRTRQALEPDRPSPRALMLDLFKKSSHRHSFPLSKEQIPALLHRYYSNGVELYEDAALLRANKRYARAVFLCLTA